MCPLNTMINVRERRSFVFLLPGFSYTLLLVSKLYGLYTYIYTIQLVFIVRPSNPRFWVMRAFASA